MQTFIAHHVISLMQTQLSLLNISFTLQRYPLQKNEKHQAWDAADEYLIEQLEKESFAKDAHILIFNDNFGALCCYAIFKGFRVTAINDSLLSQQSIEQNLKANHLFNSDRIDLLSSIDPLPENIDIAIMKLPKNNRLLVWQLSQLASLTNNSLSLISAAKAREIHSSTLALFEKHLGSTKTSLAKKKARLIFCQKQKQLKQLPKSIIEFSVPEYQLRLRNYPNVFSAEKLDIAAYLMLKYIPQSSSFEHIIDLGCGNGVLAIAAARKNPNAKITIVDESHMAVASAKMNLLNHDIDKSRINPLVNNSLSGFTPNTAQLVLCNPPFHQQHTITDHIAWQMFLDAKQVLTEKGRLIVIGNRHLGYQAKMARLFTSTKIIASNAKFTIIEGVKD